MARVARGSLEGAFCHLIARGNRGQHIFVDEADYRRFVADLSWEIPRAGCRLYAYVLMPNHIHLLAEVGNEPPGKLMQRLLTSHARYFNTRHQQTGHLFQGRYQALVCERDSYLLELVRYLHLNPVRAGLCSEADEWPWSSHPYYLGATGGEWTVAKEALELFAADRRRALQAYRRFLGDGMAMGHRPDFYPRRHAPGAGSEARAKAVLVRLCKTLGTDWEQVCSPLNDRATSAARALAAWVAVRHANLPRDAVGQLFSRHRSSVARALVRAEAILAADPALHRKILSLTSSKPHT